MILRAVLESNGLVGSCSVFIVDTSGETKCHACSGLTREASQRFADELNASQTLMHSRVAEAKAREEQYWKKRKKRRRSEV
jgi:hypothetical protein